VGVSTVGPLGFDVTLYEVMALPPSEAGGLKLTVAWAFPAVAVTFVGALGAVGVGSGVLQPASLKETMRVLQLKVPFAFKYSVVYQKVQSSTGSTVIAL